MKKLLFLALTLFAFETYACQCSKYPLVSEDAMEAYLYSNFHYRGKLTDENITWLKYYPTAYERFFSKDFMGTSCGNEGPNNEPMFHCANRDKSDFLLKFPELNCEAILQVTSTYSSIKIKTLRSNCPRND